MSALTDRINRVYLDGFSYWKETPNYMDEVSGAARALADALGGELTPPRNLDNYFRVQVCITPGVRTARFALTWRQVERKKEIVYLEILVAVVAKVAEASWHTYRVTDTFDHDSFELLDTAFLDAHPALEATAERVMELVDEVGLELLGWDVTRAPADTRLPEEPWMAGAPQVRHFLLPGYWD